MDNQARRGAAEDGQRPPFVRILVATALFVGLLALPSQAQDTTEATPPPADADDSSTTEAAPAQPAAATPAETDDGSSTTTGADSTTSSTPPVDETTTTTGGDGSTTAPPTTLSAEDRERRARAAGNLNAARAADSEIASGLQAITEAAQTTQSKVDRARSRLEAAQATLETATAELAQSDEQQAAIEEQLRTKAVEGFKSGADETNVFFTDRNMNQTLRQTQLLQQANRSTAELLEELRALKEDRRVAQAEAEQAALDAEQLEQELTAELETLREQEGVQLRLRAEAQSRIARWESELTAYAAEDAAIQRLISEGGSPAPATSPQPRQPSALGYQWPVTGRVSSGFGYRIHPVYGTRKLHSGLDVAAPGGTPISATSDGVVIFTGRRGGYGNTVIIDHGGGLTSLYAHMSEIGAADGATVRRGDVIGYVGATGTATGNHLHFEIRYDGTPTDPAPYLP